MCLDPSLGLQFDMSDSEDFSPFSWLLGGPEMGESLLGDDGDKRPSPQQMAMATAIKGRENEIRQDMAKFFKQMKEEMSDAFKKMDADGNGFLSKDEIKKVLEENSKTWGHVDDQVFDQVDVNGDGKISLEGNFSFFKYTIFVLSFLPFISEFLKWISE